MSFSLASINITAPAISAERWLQSGMRPKPVKETSMALVGVYTRKGIVGLIEGGQLTIDGINYGVGALQKVSMITGEPPESLLKQLATQVELASSALNDLKSQS